jgi:hypothetical protein
MYLQFSAILISAAAEQLLPAGSRKDGAVTVVFLPLIAEIVGLEARIHPRLLGTLG